MDLSYNAVAAKCAEQMAAYQNCVEKNANGDWANICRPQGRALTQCADGCVPHLAELKSTCANQIASYRSCLESNASAPDEIVSEKCGGLMAALWECSESAMKRIEAESGGAGAAGGAGGGGGGSTGRLV